jgi:hypothetical protein
MDKVSLDVAGRAKADKRNTALVFGSNLHREGRLVLLEVLGGPEQMSLHDGGLLALVAHLGAENVIAPHVLRRRLASE